MSNTVKFSKETIDTLKKIYEVNQGLKLVENANVIKCKSTDKTALVHAPISESIPRDFHIYDLREFLSVLSIIESPTVDFSNDKYLVVKSDDGKQKLRYLESDPEFVTSYPEKDINIKEFDVEVTVTGEQFNSVLKAAATMNLEYIGFICNDEKISISTFNKNNGDDSVTNNFAIDLIEVDGLCNFEMFYKLDCEKISVLAGEGNLVFKISKNKVSMIETETGKTFWLTMNIKSTWG